jgi:hypothetical protein
MVFVLPGSRAPLGYGLWCLSARAAIGDRHASNRCDHKLQVTSFGGRQLDRIGACEGLHG